jgi:rhomboid protease GluP
MDFQSVLAVNMMAICAFLLLLILVQRRREGLSFAAVHAATLAVGLLALWRFPDEAGGLVALVFVPLVAAPMTLAALQARYTRLGRPETAARCADLAAFLHPTAAMRLSAAFARAAAIEDPRERARAFAALADHAPPEQAAVIETRLLADRGDWEKALVLAQNPENARQLAAYRLRALGETGRIEALLRDFAASADAIPPEQTLFSWLFVLAFAGRPVEVEELAHVMRLDADTAAYWIAVARRHGGDAENARLAFEGLAMSRRETPAAIAARRQIATDWPAPTPLSPGAREIVEGVAERVATESARRGRGFRPPPVTLLLLAANTLFFVAEVALGGSQDAETLIRLGALWAPLALDGEIWRVFTATLLHYGPLHFGLNMLMLALVSRDLEYEIGGARTLVAYVGGAVFSSSVVLAAMDWGLVGYGLYVGASGAIFALFGVVAALRFKDWLRHRASLDAHRAIALGAVMLVQIAADFLLPMSSLTAHLTGFGFGAAFGMLTGMRARP